MAAVELLDEKDSLDRFTQPALYWNTPFQTT